MHDQKGRALKEGDLVLIPCRIKQTMGGEDYCNVYLETLYGRRPDASKETISAINTGVVLRNNEGDTNSAEDLKNSWVCQVTA